jgi:glycosyltransferase involved in cell wall biosynthesis
LRDDPDTSGEASGKCDTLRDAFARIRENPELDRHFDRTAAARITRRPTGSGASFFVVKSLIRAYRHYRREIVGGTKLASVEVGSIDPDAILLLPDINDLGDPRSAAKRTRTRLAFVCHDLISWLYPEFVTKRQTDRARSQLLFLIQSGAHALCTSNASRAMLERFLAESGSPSIRVDQFPLPSVLYEKARTLGRDTRFEPGQPFVLYCSTVEPRKNHLLLAKIWKQAHDQGVALPKLVCVGVWRPGMRELHAYLAEHPQLSQRIDFRGPLDDMELIDLYRSALFCVAPSQVEGWGYGASESLDFGVPVIISTTPALKEAVRGLMPAVNPDDQSEWFAAIRRLAQEPEMRAALSQRIAARYRPIACRDSWEVIRDALKNPARPIGHATIPGAKTKVCD